MGCKSFISNGGILKTYVPKNKCFYSVFSDFPFLNFSYYKAWETVTTEKNRFHIHSFFFSHEKISNNISLSSFHIFLTYVLYLFYLEVIKK